MGGYTRAVSGQRLSKHVPIARQQNLNNARVGLQQWKSCFLCGLWPDIISKGQGQLFSSVRESVRRGPEPEAEE
jgi:hypothetical protein